MSSGYSILLADPPWHYRDNKSNNPALGGKQYAMMTNEQLAKIPFRDIAAKDSLMFCWMVMPKLYECLAIMEAWGFEPVTCGFVWVKLNKKSRGVEQGELLDPSYNVRKGVWLDRGVYSGLGSYTCGNVELCYIGKRGRGITRQNKSVKQIIFAPLGRHSAKPIEVHQRIDALYDVQYPRIEFFARAQPYSEHWDATGLEYDDMDVYAFIQEANRFNYSS